MMLSSEEMESLRMSVLAACEDEQVDPGEFPAWDLASGWPDPARGKLWTIANIPQAHVAVTLLGIGDLARVLRNHFDPECDSPWALVNGRMSGEVWMVWPTDREPPHESN